MRFAGAPNLLALSAEERIQALRVAANAVASLGTEVAPEPPRNIIAQPGSRKAVVTWLQPQRSADVTGYRIYKDNEGSIVATVESGDALRYEVPLSSGSTAPVTNIFISSVNAGGKESARIQVQCAAIVEVAAPSDPAPPSGPLRIRRSNLKSDFI